MPNRKTKQSEINHQLKFLDDIMATSSRDFSLGRMKQILRKVLDYLNAQAGGILLVNEIGQITTYWVQTGLEPGSAEELFSFGLATRSMSTDKIVKTEEPILLKGSACPVNMKFISVPVKSGEKIIAVMNIAGETAFITRSINNGLLKLLGHAIGLALKNMQLDNELTSAEEKRADLLHRIILAQENERQRIARELHDVTSQTLATLAVGLEAMAKSGPDNKRSDNQIEGIRSLLEATSKDVHQLIYDLRPSMLDDLGLAAAVRSWAHNSLSPADISVRVEIVGQERRARSEVEIAIFRIVQEAVSNIALHSKAESAYVGLEYRKNSIVVRIEDDGVGFDFSPRFKSREFGQWFGLLGMKERMELLGGKLSIKTRPGCGTRIVAEIPVIFKEEYGKD